MKFFAVAATVFAGLALAALAAPAAEQQLDSRQAYVPCSGLYGSQQCCATDVLGVADLDCGSRKNPNPNPDSFLRSYEGASLVEEYHMLTDPGCSSQLPTRSRPPMSSVKSVPPSASALAAASYLS
ncbi:cryparin [Apiospora hydei]|uniref:Cryparin n=1 Tax=Apiospora hydei TaxID=1337664 RepID=A0ABR1X3N9_9PEZI